MYDSRGTLPSLQPQEYNNDCTLCVWGRIYVRPCVAADCCLYAYSTYVWSAAEASLSFCRTRGVMFPLMSNTVRRLGFVFVIWWRSASSQRAGAEHRHLYSHPQSSLNMYLVFLIGQSWLTQLCWQSVRSVLYAALWWHIRIALQTTTAAAAKRQLNGLFVHDRRRIIGPIYPCGFIVSCRTFGRGRYFIFFVIAKNCMHKHGLCC